jgi:deoxyribonuclease V
MDQITAPIELIIVDSCVQLDDRPGLVQHVFDHFHEVIRVIGVAETSFQNARNVEILRGFTAAPLFITAVGYGIKQAGTQVQAVHGRHHIPKLLKRVDQKARK